MKTIYYAEFFDDKGNPFKRKPNAMYLKASTAKSACTNTMNRLASGSWSETQPAACRLYALTGELTLVQEYGTVVEHVEGQDPLFEL